MFQKDIQNLRRYPMISKHIQWYPMISKISKEIQWGKLPDDAQDNVFYPRLALTKLHEFCSGNSFLSSDSYHSDARSKVCPNLPNKEQNNLHGHVLESKEVIRELVKRLCGPDSCTRKQATSNGKSLRKCAEKSAQRNSAHQQLFWNI